MPRKLEHTYYGAVVALGHATLSTRGLSPGQAIAEAMGYAMGGGLGGQLPDRIEPATHPNHRKFAHSASLGVGVALLLARYGPQVQLQFRQVGEGLMRDREKYDPESWQWMAFSLLGMLAHVLAGIVVGVPIGYLSHLGLDHVKSSKGIPLLA